VRKIGIGQRFRQIGPPRTVWEVLEAVLDPAGRATCRFPFVYRDKMVGAPGIEPGTS
jgi:hypothetical protein